MKNEEKLLLAIGEISDDIIAEVSAPYKRKIAPTRRTLAVAASIAVVAVGITLLPGLLEGKKFDKNVGGNAAPEMNGAADGSEGFGNHFGSLAYVGSTDSAFNFKLTLDAVGAHLDVCLKSADGSVIYTTEDITVDGVEVRRPTLTVNGEAVEALPSLPGEYDITVSFDGMESDIEWCEYITFSPFGDYYCFN